ncbi:MAG: hypothetical protein FD167_2896 [bacterium]|nr:MAG: hypothetical protein FD167_2896 [bacterium]
MKAGILCCLLGLLLLLTSITFTQAQPPIGRALQNQPVDNLRVVPDKPGEGVMIRRGMRNHTPIPLKQTVL